MVRPPPAGYEPLQLCVACPPGGLAIDIAVVAVDFPVDGYQILTLFRKRQKIFGSFLVTLVALSAIFQILSLEGENPIELAKTSLQRGQIDFRLQHAIDIDKTIEATGSVLLGGYGMSLVADLTTFEAVNAVVSVLLSAKATAEYFTRAELNRSPGLEIVAKRAMPLFGSFIKFIRLCTALGFFATVIVVSRSTHPLLSFLVLSSLTFAKLRFQFRPSTVDKRGRGTSFAYSVIPSHVWIYPHQCSVYGFRTTGNQVCEPALAHYLMVILRCAVFASMCIALSLPHGLMPWWTLGRPMGADTFRTEFFEPTVMVISRDFNDEAHMNFASACFRSFLVIAGVFGSSIDMLFSFYVLTCMRSYCNGVHDKQLEKEGNMLQLEIDQWCDERRAEVQAGRFELLTTHE